MRNTRRLCCIILSTLGREVMVRRPCVFGEDGWPLHADPFEVKAGQTITLTTRTDVEATGTLLPVTYPQLHNMAQEGDTIYIGRWVEQWFCVVLAASYMLKVKAATSPAQAHHASNLLAPEQHSIM